MIPLRSTVAILTLALAASGCDSTAPRALVSGQDACSTCRMTIDDIRFGALLITAKGKIETFDSIECLASFVATLPPALAPRGVYVADFDHPSHWLDARRAQYLHQGQLHSPMGRELAAFPADSAPETLTARFGGHSVTWTDVLSMTRTKLGIAPRGARHDHALSPTRARAS
jgi:copper chaperone NosL